MEVQWVIPIQKVPSNISVVIDAPTETVVRKICEQYSIAVFSITEYTQEGTHFGNVFFRFLEENDTITIYTQQEKAKDAYKYFRDAGFVIDYINNSQHLLNDEDVKRVVAKLADDYNKSHAIAAKHEKSYFWQISDMLVKKTTAELEELKTLSTKAAEEAEILMSKIQSTQATMVLKIKNAEDELKKAKLGSNVVKIRDLIGDLYKLMETAELIYLEEQKENEIQIAEWSIVTYLDIVAEREKYQKSKNMQKAWANKSWTDTYYMFFGTVWLYQKLLGKDIQNKFKDIITILDTLYTIIVFFILMSMVRLVLFQLFNVVMYDATFFTLSFIDLGIMGICSALLMQRKEPNLFRLIIIGPLVVGIYLVLHALIYTHFWL